MTIFDLSICTGCSQVQLHTSLTKFGLYRELSGNTQNNHCIQYLYRDYGTLELAQNLTLSGNTQNNHRADKFPYSLFIYCPVCVVIQKTIIGQKRG